VREKGREGERERKHNIAIYISRMSKENTSTHTKKKRKKTN
jgi:hypothetical protein